MTKGHGMVKDGYEWLERFDRNHLRRKGCFRRMLLCYFKPWKSERYGNGAVYRLLGVDHFGKYLPTGGIVIRRITGRRMQAYTLKGLSRASMKEFRYKSCLFETLHMPFFIALTWRGLWWYLAMGNVRLAVELFVVNLFFNIYPMMHQRYTRVRINRIIGQYPGPDIQTASQ